MYQIDFLVHKFDLTLDVMRHCRRVHNFENFFSNSLIIHAALTQPEHLILVRWMSLEIQ